MSFKELLAALESKDFDKAKDIATSLETDFNANVSEINKLEGKATEAIQTRDKSKARIRELATTLNLDVEDLTSEKIKEILESSNKGGNSNEDIAALETKYKTQIDDLSKKFENTENEYKTKLADADKRYNDTLIDRELLKQGVGANVVNEKALSVITEMLKENAVIEDGNIIYRDKDGLNIRNDKGQPLTIAGKLEALQADESNAFLFKSTTQQGGGSQSSSNASQGGQKMSMSDAMNMSTEDYNKFISGGGQITE